MSQLIGHCGRLVNHRYHYSNTTIPLLCYTTLFTSRQNGYTPLHIAAKKDETEIATALLDHKARPDAESRVRSLLGFPILLIVRIFERYCMYFACDAKYMYTEDDRRKV